MPPLSAVRPVRLLLLAASAFLAGACATTPNKAPKAAPGGKFIVTANRTAFYKYGPAQAFGPDFQLQKGQKVLMVKREYGFSRVLTEDLSTGYVASEDLQPAPPDPLPPKPVAVPPPTSAKPASRSGGRLPGPSNVEPLPGSALFDVSDLPQAPLPQGPLPENPESKPAPLPEAEPKPDAAPETKPEPEAKPKPRRKAKPVAKPKAGASPTFKY